MARKRILVIFPKEWDREEFARGDVPKADRGFDISGTGRHTLSIG